jgi:hypothetical protein
LPAAALLLGLLLHRTSSFNHLDLAACLSCTQACCKAARQLLLGQMEAQPVQGCLHCGCALQQDKSRLELLCVMLPSGDLLGAPDCTRALSAAWQHMAP